VNRQEKPEKTPSHGDESPSSVWRDGHAAARDENGRAGRLEVSFNVARIEVSRGMPPMGTNWTDGGKTGIMLHNVTDCYTFEDCFGVNGRADGGCSGGGGAGGGRGFAR